LLQRHPNWTPAEVKSALVLTGRPVWTDATRSREVVPTREGGGLIDLAAATDPLAVAAPSTVSFRFLHRGPSRSLSVELSGAGGGAGAWTVAVQTLAAAGGTTVSAAATISVPGLLSLHVAVASSARQGDTTGFVILSRGSVTRRIPFWLRVTVPVPAQDRHRTLVRPGLYGGDTARQASRVSCYR